MHDLLTERLWPSWTACQERQTGEGALQPGPLTPAATLVPIIDRPGGLTLLLTQRTDHLNDHPGQISFPGGRMDAGDENPMATALRETEEEIGLARQFVSVAGYLDAYATGTGFLVTPVVGLVSPGFSLALDPFEVAEVFEVPLEYLLDARNYRREELQVRVGKRWFYVIEYERRYIWGATAGMLMNLSQKLRGD
jgi:8-oxo-dGTP pyrophosphatase MutT (NUDIX family)